MTDLAPVAVVLLGLCVGSYVNVLIHRLPREEPTGTARSRCPRCAATLGWFDLVPVLSFLLLGGRCRRCRGRISWRYPLVEVVTALLALAVLGRFGLGAAGALYFAFGAALIAVTFIDLDARIIPDVITLPGVALGIGAVAATRLGAAAGLEPPRLLVSGPLAAALGAAGGATALWLVAFLYRRATGIDGLGLGDVKLAALLGAFLGGGGVFLTVLLAALAGSAAGLLLIVAGRGSMKSALPFGTFLAPAGILVLFHGQAIIGWYLARTRGG